MLLCTFPMLLCLFPMPLCTFPLPQRRRSPSGKLFHGTPASSSSATALPARNTSASAPWPATSSRWLFATLPLANSSATAPRPAAFASCPYQQLPHGAPASNKPHPAEKSTPVWLAIWRTWAGFANSQLLSAAFRSIYLYIDGPIPLAATLGCCSNRRKSVGPSAPIAYATSVSPADEAAAWPGRRYPMGDKAVAWPGCKCPMGDKAVAWPDAAFLQITEHTNPCSRHLWGTLARAVASILAHRARL